ncbi:MAG: hypothetical protein D3909_09860, partial [Candidatus Electrothrix sp. ATG1]|nr:hypothetical protein [Candidatus Electrothrix sp. ATG1]
PANDTTKYNHYFNWISEREALENNKLRRFLDSGKVFGKDDFERDQVLQQVKTAVEKITGFAGLFHDRELHEFTLRKNFDTEKNALLFSQLSSGEQHLVAFVVTLAVFLAFNFPEAETPLHEKAVFLIDAIELHLHPSWQRKIIHKLLSCFPNCQFIITTHSPQVLGNVKPESIFLLKQEEDEITCEQPDESYGMTMDRVLELVMDDESRPNQKIREEMETLFDYISRKEFDEAANLIKTLKEDIPTDPDLIRAEMVLHKIGLSLFAYENLLASCNRKESCGHKKGKWYSSALVSPLGQDCEQRFTYTLDGRIIPSDKKDSSASETIEQLGLNCPKLKNQRKNIILALDNGKNDPEPSYLQTVAAGILKREGAWPFGFYTVLLFLAELYEIPIPQ